MSISTSAMACNASTSTSCCGKTPCPVRLPSMAIVPLPPPTHTSLNLGPESCILSCLGALMGFLHRGHVSRTCHHKGTLHASLSMCSSGNSTTGQTSTGGSRTVSTNSFAAMSSAVSVGGTDATPTKSGPGCVCVGGRGWGVEDMHRTIMPAMV